MYLMLLDSLKSYAQTLLILTSTSSQTHLYILTHKQVYILAQSYNNDVLLCGAS